MYKFQQLKKSSKKYIEGKEIRVAVLGNCATQFFSLAIQGYAKNEYINLSVYDADYNQIDAQLLDQYSETYSYKPDMVLLWLSTEKLYENFLELSIEERCSFAEKIISQLTYYWQLVENNCNARVIQPNFTEIPDRSFGSYSLKVSSSFSYQIRKLNYLLQEEMQKNKNVFPVDLLSVQNELGINSYYDAALYYNAKMTISLNSLPYIAKAITDVIKAMLGKIKKCVILDLDNTLWGGVIGDDGLGGIEIGELGRGHAFTNFQLWLRQLRQRGIILAVCSKNNEETAKEPFEKHKEMVLRLSDISIFVANWQDKASNIKFIQQTLNIGFDSMIFIDDNPFERNLVKEMLPDVEVPDLPDDPALYLGFLHSCNYFETASYSAADSDRTKQYQAEAAREKMKHSFASIDDYLKGLQMIGRVKTFEPVCYSRIAQLTQRSNQFNLRTVRYTEGEIKNIAESDNYIALYYTLKDKLGDHGLISVVIMKKESADTLFIDTWLMSCRVLKRGMEEFIVNSFVKCVCENGYKIIKAEYIPTPKNSMVKDIYKKMGFTELSEHKYVLDIDNFVPHKTYISKEED